MTAKDFRTIAASATRYEATRAFRLELSRRGGRVTRPVFAARIDRTLV